MEDGRAYSERSCCTMLCGKQGEQWESKRRLKEKENKKEKERGRESRLKALSAGWLYIWTSGRKGRLVTLCILVLRLDKHQLALVFTRATLVRSTPRGTGSLWHETIALVDDLREAKIADIPSADKVKVEFFRTKGHIRLVYCLGV